MSDRQKPSPSNGVLGPTTPEAEEEVYTCTCGTPDTSENWICCDNDHCPIKWHHWECVGLTQEPPGDWLCARCSPTSTKDAEVGKEQQTATTGIVDALARGSESGKVVANKAHVRAKKGIAVKKVLPKKQKAKWILVETDSESGEEHKGSVDAAQDVVIVAEGRRTKYRIPQSKGRLARSRTLRRTSQKAAGVKIKKMMGSEKEDRFEEDAEDFMEIDGEGNENVQTSNGRLRYGRKESDRVPSNITGPIRKTNAKTPHGHHHSSNPSPSLPKRTPTNKTSTPIPPPKLSPQPPNPTPAPSSHPTPTSSPRNPPPDPTHTHTHTHTSLPTALHPRVASSTPPARGAATAIALDIDIDIDIEEQGRTPVIRTVTPDGSSAVDYWSYRTNTRCETPVSAVRSTLPRLL
ncbi:Histone acetyltransferase complex subunit [Imshaugia aleurites]|uniref:Histone acetyltransferase complex subunit n=1 Tax=Imshaugia aleurites TaxID=172621 RepID=A0A8H3FMR1_9LECA|nr:Histone acetyltransferase complex subunit [Imshaugia aleurites]